MGTLDDLFRRFEHLNDIGASLSNERDLNRLLEKITVAAKAITRADGGTLYLLSEDRSHLHFEIVQNTGASGWVRLATVTRPASRSMLSVRRSSNAQPVARRNSVSTRIGRSSAMTMSRRSTQMRFPST